VESSARRRYTKPRNPDPLSSASWFNSRPLSEPGAVATEATRLFLDSARESRIRKCYPSLPKICQNSNAVRMRSVPSALAPGHWGASLIGGPRSGATYAHGEFSPPTGLLGMIHPALSRSVLMTSMPLCSIFDTLSVAMMAIDSYSAIAVAKSRVATRRYRSGF
jgi:hypothetical protein